MQQPPPQQPGAANPPNSYRQAGNGGFTATVGNALSQVGDALTIEPKVIPADDPVSLSSMPDKVGPEVYVALARAHEQQGQIDAARQQYERALQIAPQNATILVAYGRLLDRSGASQEALDAYERAVQANPKNALALNDLGLCRARQGDLPGSLQAMQKAVELEPAKELYRNNIATVLAEAGRFDEALQHLAAVHPPAVAHYNVGYLLQKRNRLAEAREHFSTCLQIDPSLVAAQRQLAQLDPNVQTAPRQAAQPQFRSAVHSASPAQTMRTSSFSPGGESDAAPAAPQAITAPPQDWGQAPVPQSYGDYPSTYEPPRLLPPVR